jgi:PAS domain S-box-containing protein
MAAAPQTKDLMTSQDRMVLLASIVDSSDDAILTMTPAGIVNSVNREAELLYGYTANEISGRPIAMLVPAGRIGEMAEILQKIRKGERFGHFKTARVRKDGKLISVSLTVSPIYDPAGSLIGFSSIARALSEPMAAGPVTAEWAEANLLDNILQSATRYSIIGKDLDHCIVSWNQGAERNYGYSAEEVIGKNSEIMHAPEDVQSGALRKFLDSAYENGLAEGDFDCVRKDGTRFMASVVATRRNNAAGHPIGLLVMSSDISVRLRHQRDLDLTAAAKQFRLGVESAPAGMLMMDTAGRIVLSNARAEKMFGYSRRELHGRQMEMLVPERFRQLHPSFLEGFRAAPEAGPVGYGRELFGLCKDGTEIPIEVALNPIETHEGKFVLSSIVDITERRRFEQEREALLAQLRVLNGELEERVSARTTEVAERNVLLQEVHHRVKNNLQVISSLINMQVRKVEDAAARRALAECQSRVQAIALIHEKLYQSKNYARVPFSEYARSLAANIFHATGVSPAINLEVEIDNLSLAVDKAIPCGLILNELITNALKHAFPNERRGTIRVELRQAAGILELVVSDDGIGMSSAFVPATSGSLGMQLVLTLVEQLDGNLEILREVGTAFRVRFPVEVVN